MNSNPRVRINVKGFGSMTAELYPEKAPKTVENFLRLVNEGFYSGTVFHRIIKGFMIQGGGYSEGFEEKPAKPIKGEFAANGFMLNDIKHDRGVLSMARTNDPDSASSQFFIMHMNAPHLDSQYAAFGKVTEGLDTLDKIASVKTGSIGWYMQDVPKETVIIESIEAI